MFRAITKKRKGGSPNGLLNLALQDAEWKVEQGDNVLVDRKNKDIVLQQQVIREEDSTYYVDVKRNVNKAFKILAIADAKYGGKRNMVGVKHLQPHYIEMATKLSVYWYAEKKALLRYGLTRPLTFYIDYLREHETKLEGLVSMYSNQKSVRSMAEHMIKDPYILHRTIRGNSVAREFNYYFKGDSSFADSNNADLMSRMVRICQIVRQAYKMTMSVRKDAKAFPNKRLKEVAQYLYEELEHNNELYQPFLSERLADLGEIELDLQGMDFDTEINEQVGEMLARSTKYAGTNQDVRWANMHIKYPPLVQSLGTKVLGKSKKNSDVGINPRNMHRRLTDNKVFTVKSKRKGGTVLIDVSGSMRLDTDDIFEIIETLPASTIAIYSGQSYPEQGNAEDAYGELQIVGKDGRYVADIPSHGYNNLIDGPAIQWLSQQAEPRILVSDLQFTGINYASERGGEVGVSTELLTDCMEVIAKKNILPIPDVEKAKEWISRYGSKR
tara:strand:+ start:1703 stop:3196 length:1494 start_codon:yes stop_codon:yes gene_type:complete